MPRSIDWSEPSERTNGLSPTPRTSCGALTGVRLALELESGRGSRPLLADALQEVDRAIHLVDDLLTTAKRPSSGESRTPVRVSELLSEEIGPFRLRFPHVTINVSNNTSNNTSNKMKGETESDSLMIDREGIRRVIRNLLDNTAFYGRGAVQVTMASGSPSHPPSGPSSFTLAIDDDGPGIAAEDRSRIFDRFTRLDSSRARETGGSGLGLAIAMEIIHDHGGQIHVDDSPLGGARFTVALPRV